MRGENGTESSGTTGRRKRLDKESRRITEQEDHLARKLERQKEKEEEFAERKREMSGS